MSRRTWTAINLALLAAPASAQLGDLPPVTYPALPPSAANEAGLVPPGWTAAKRAIGDLNGDGRPDLALLLRMTSKANVLPIPNSESAETFDTNPFLLVVAFTDSAGGYRVVTSTHRFFQRPEIPYSGDVPPGEGDSVRIERGTLLLANEYLRGHDGYRFRWDKGEFRLIGFESGGSSGGCIETISINYLTGKVLWSNTPISDDKSVAVTRRIKPGPVPMLATIDLSTFIPSDTIAGDAPRCDPR